MSAGTAARKDTRLDLRLSHDEKRLLEEAAAFAGTTTSAFVVQTVTERAREVVQRHRALELSTAESHAFVERLLAPEEPNEALRNAVKRYGARLDTSR